MPSCPGSRAGCSGDGPSCRAYPGSGVFVGVFFVVYLALNLVFDRPVRACAGTLADKPLTAFAVGLLVLLLAGPVCALLAVSVVGLVVGAIRPLRARRGGHGRQSRHGAMDRDGYRAPRARGGRNPAAVAAPFHNRLGDYHRAHPVAPAGLRSPWRSSVLQLLGAATLAFVAVYRRENPAPPPRRPAFRGVVHAVPSRKHTPQVADAPAVAFSPPVQASAPSRPQTSQRFRARGSAIG